MFYYADQLKKLGTSYRDSRYTKLLANSLYGRLGIDGVLLSTQIAAAGDSPSEYAEFQNIKDLRLVNKKTKMANTDSNIGIAAIITSRARIKLYHAMQFISGEGGRVLYVDTDSLVCAFKQTEVLSKKIMNFFDFSKKETIIMDAVFIAPKSYALRYDWGEVVRIKGVDVPDLKFEDIKKAFYMDETLSLRKSSASREGLSYSFISEEVLIKLNAYNKRKFSSDKRYTTPLCRV